MLKDLRLISTGYVSIQCKPKAVTQVLFFTLTNKHHFLLGKGKVSVTSLGRPIRPALISGFRSTKRLGVFILLPGWDASPLQGYPQHYTGTHLYTWVERGTVRVKCLAQEHNTMSPARA